MTQETIYVIDVSISFIVIPASKCKARSLGYLTTFLHSVIFPIFQNYQVLDTYKTSHLYLANVTAAQDMFNMYFCKIKIFLTENWRTEI